MDMRVETAAPFIPTAPPRDPGELPLWKLFVGPVAANPLLACTEANFREFYLSRRVLNLTYHSVSDPEGIRRILLDNQANYVKPRLIARLLPELGEGLFGADG